MTTPVTVYVPIPGARAGTGSLARSSDLDATALQPVQRVAPAGAYRGGVPDPRDPDFDRLVGRKPPFDEATEPGDTPVRRRHRAPNASPAGARDTTDLVPGRAITGQARLEALSRYQTMEWLDGRWAQPGTIYDFYA